jgi:hypothetical protein
VNSLDGYSYITPNHKKTPHSSVQAPPEGLDWNEEKYRRLPFFLLDWKRTERCVGQTEDPGVDIAGHIGSRDLHSLKWAVPQSKGCSG